MVGFINPKKKKIEYCKLYLLNGNVAESMKMKYKWKSRKNKIIKYVWNNKANSWLLEEAIIRNPNVVPPF